MIKFLFVQIPKLIYEPIAVFGWIGVFMALSLQRRNKSIFGQVVLFSLLFLVGWRLLAHNLMKSSRYSAILLYPMTVFAVWFCFMSNKIVLYVQSRFKSGENLSWFKNIPYIFLCFLTIICLYKIFHVNPFDSYIVETCRTLSKDIDKGKSVVYTDDEQRRVVYYTKADNYDLIQPIKNDERRITINHLNQRIHTLINLFKNQYFIFHYKKGEPIPRQDVLGISKKEGNWTIVQKMITSRNHKGEIYLCRFSPHRPNIDIWEGEIPSQSSNNLSINGNFEKAQTGQELKTTTASLIQQGFSAISDSDILFPASWRMRYYYYKDDPEPSRATQLSPSNPIEGKYSLYFDTRRSSEPAVFWCSGIPVQQREFTYSFFFRNEGEDVAKLRLETRSSSATSPETPVINTLLFQIPPKDLYRIHGDISKEQIPLHARSIYLSFRVHGSASIDLLDIIPKTE